MSEMETFLDRLNEAMDQYPVKKIDQQIGAYMAIRAVRDAVVATIAARSSEANPTDGGNSERNAC